METNYYILRLVYIFLLCRMIDGLIADENSYALLQVKKVIAVAGKDRRIVLSCPYTRRIPVIWRRNGRIIYNSKNTMLSYGTLVIRPVQLDVEGLYECRSEELFGSKYRAVFNVSINESPRILKRNKRHLYVNGSSADYLNCKANGKPKPDVFWINEKGFSPINPPTIIRISETTLKVTNLKSGGSKVIICVAQNVYGRAKVKFKVGPETEAAAMPKEKNEIKKILLPTTVTTTTLQTTTKKGRPPRFTKRPPRINYARRGSKMIMHCDADGEPKPEILITKIRPNKVKIKGKIIEEISDAHLGIYECKASNFYGTIKYPFLIKIRGGRRKVYNYSTRRKTYNPYATSFGQWSNWSSCSTKCGMGIQTRTRKCTVRLIRFRDRLCYGRTIKRRTCFGRYCRRRVK